MSGLRRTAASSPAVERHWPSDNNRGFTAQQKLEASTPRVPVSLPCRSASSFARGLVTVRRLGSCGLRDTDQRWQAFALQHFCLVIARSVPHRLANSIVVSKKCHASCIVFVTVSGTNTRRMNAHTAAAADVAGKLSRTGSTPHRLCSPA